ncbi:hypothetical protein [Bifidobacterium indicum]|uniref:hypothetical protein n=1 Tax=Bifidobacterium indicum TaxID=1691 RepID=UPI0030DCDDB3
MDEERTPDDQETKTLSDMDDFTAPPAIKPAGGPDEARKPRPKWLVPVVSAGVVVVLVAAGFGGWKVYESRRHGSAMADCTQSVKAMQSSTRSAQATLARYRGAAGIQADQVQDAKTVDAMHRTIKTAGGIRPQVVVCDASMSTSDLHAATDKARRTSEHLKDIDRDYAKAGKAVIMSRDAKILEDAKSALAGKKDEAARLLGDSDGKVADNATRDALQKAIDQAGGVKGGKAKDYQDAATALQAAVDQVNASMQAKAQADQQAAEQAAQQQAAAQQQPAPSYGGGGYTPSYSGGGYTPSYNRGGGSAPAPAPAAPAPATPQGGGSNWRDIINHVGPPVCQKGQACGIG